MGILVAKRRIVPIEQRKELAIRAIERRQKLQYFVSSSARGYLASEDQRDGQFSDKPELWARINSTAVDSHETIIEPKGIDAERFRANPILLWQHGMDQRGNLPIGVVPELIVSEDAVDARVEFDVADEFSANVLRMYRSRVLRGFSVGFIPLAHEVRRIGFAGEEKRDTLIFTGWELVELSCVAVPSNPEALAA